MILTTMPVFDYISYNLFEFSPNPNTEQLLALSGKYLNLAFEGEDNDSISVNFVTLNGNVELSWESDPKKVFL